MGIKWKEDYRAETQRKFGLWIGFTAGATSAWIIYGIYTSWRMFESAPWWDVMTAIGTVGAVVVALYVSFGESRVRALQRESRAGLYRGMLVSGMAGVWDSLVETFNLIEELNSESRSQQGTLRLKNISSQSDEIFFVDALVDHIAMAENLPAPEMQRVTSLHGYMKMLQRLGPDLARQLDGNKSEAKRVSARMMLAINSIRFLCGEIECLRDAIKEGELVTSTGMS